MRITFKILFVVLLVVMLSLAFTACDTGNGDDVVVCTHQWGEWKAVREPTCNEKGTAQRVCSACGESETCTIEALDHIFDLEKGRFLWSEDHLSADYEYSCLRCGDAEKAIAKVTRTTVPADCEKAEEIIYTATYIENGDTYTDTYSESGPEVGHDYDIDSVEWLWNGNESAQVSLTCKRNESHKLILDAEITKDQRTGYLYRDRLRCLYCDSGLRRQLSDRYRDGRVCRQRAPRLRC